jgi:hypothetical protein
MGAQPIAQLESAAKHNVGQRVTAHDYAYGEIEAVYLPGVASVAAGDVVVFDEASGATVRAVSGKRGPLAVALADVVAGQYGWFAVLGSVPVNIGSNLPSVGPAYLSTTAGEITGLAAEGEKIDGATVVAVPSAGFATVRLTRPSANGNDGNAFEDRG